MNDPSGAGHVLVAHPDTPAHAVAGVIVTNVWLDADEWRFDFTVMAPPSALELRERMMAAIRTYSDLHAL